MKARLSDFSLSPGIPLLLTFFSSHFCCDATVMVPGEGKYIGSPSTDGILQGWMMATAPTTLSFEKQKGLISKFSGGFPALPATTASGPNSSSVSSRFKRKSRVRRSKSFAAGKDHHFLSSSSTTSTTRHQNSLHKRSTTTISLSPADLFLQIFMDYSVSPSEQDSTVHVKQDITKRSRPHRSFRTAAVVHANENGKVLTSQSQQTSKIPTTSFGVESGKTSTTRLGFSNNAAVVSSSSSSLSPSSSTPALAPSQIPAQSTSPSTSSTSSFCPVGHFACANPTLCVPQTAICNGKRECPDGSDENQCVNLHEKKFWDSFFQKRPAAEIDGDDAKKNRTCHYKIQGSLRNETKEHDPSSSGSSSDHGEFHDLLARGECRCSQEKILCHNVHLPNLFGFPEDIKFLDLSGCRIDELDFPRERFHQLQTLVLSSCSLREITTKTFSELPSLRVLHLTGNHLRRIPPSTFASNGNLTKLYLGHNHLTLDSQSFRGLEALEYLDLRKNRLTGEESSVFEALGQLRILHLSFNDIRRINTDFFTGLLKLEMLSLTKNKISTIDQGALNHSPLLKHLYLSYNRLSVLENGMFCHLQDLLNLNLNDNGITRIEPKAFQCLDSLQSLILEKNPFRELQKDGQEDGDPRMLFANLTNLQHIYFDEWWMCWWAPHVRSCEPKGDGISSVENLLDSVILRVSVWIMGLVGVVGNLFVVISRLVIREKNKAHSFYIKNLAFADLLMGLFLISIAYHDISFRGHFLAHQHAWRHSLTCQFSGMLSTLSSESSVFILFLITLDRYLSIVRPFAERSNTLLPAVFICLLLWLMCGMLSYAPLAPFFRSYFEGTFYSSNGLCLPLHIHNPYETGWEYSFFLFIVVNSVAFTFICYAYWKMLRIIQMSTTSIRSTQQKQDGMLVKRFGLVVLTDFMCWAPIITIKVVAMCGVQIQSDLYAWLAVFVLPVNSALNPVLYTLSTKLFKQQVSHFTVGFRKRLGLATDDSTSSFLYRNRISRTLQTSLNSSMMLSTRRHHASTRDGGGGVGGHLDRDREPNISSRGGTVIKDRMPNKMSSRVSSYSPPTAGNSPVRISATATSASGGGCHVIPYGTDENPKGTEVINNGQLQKEILAESEL